ncbi:uncharacterized protein LOC111703371 [Eurytemora carolleeae]|uniref:uncharacterized protein LOC111703371 n=1 Tax=Eurytemora carolleeae TaxID=1294199 RepID=UPI000C7726A3|nr:uncharacterized protein LOC111703371 [Eurytemora carolleeae]|eukprot:XP_023331057.1 uncharacterized protein LOC111703371 [Eurytemora affinis]
MENTKQISDLEKLVEDLKQSISTLQMGQTELTRELVSSSISARISVVERKQEEILRLMTGIRSELAGLSSGMARRDSLLLGSGIPLRDSTVKVPGGGVGAGRRNSLLVENTLCGRGANRRRSLATDILLVGKSGNIPVLEVEPWEPSDEVQMVIDRLLERQFILSPWVKEKRLRNQLRLVLKDHLEAGPERRSTITKIVHDAHQVFPLWRGQIREIMFENWCTVLDASLKESAEIIFEKFKKPRFPDENDSTLFLTEHMIEVGQFLKKKEKEGTGVTNSKFWYEVRKKICQVLDEERTKVLPIKDDDSEIEYED